MENINPINYKKSEKNDKTSEKKKKPNISIEVLDYYHSIPYAQTFKAIIGLLPKQLREESNIVFYLKTEDKKTEDIYEKNLESTIDYINTKRKMNKHIIRGGIRPHFVTNKNLLTAVASASDLNIYACQFNGVIYLSSRSEEEVLNLIKNSSIKIPNIKYGLKNEEMLTKKDGRNIEGKDRKAVFLAKIPNEGKPDWIVFYSGQIDAITKISEGVHQHHELKLLVDGARSPNLWEKQQSRNMPAICHHYWQCIFGRCDSLIISHRSNNHVLGQDELNLDDIPTRVRNLAEKHQWTVEDGENRIRELCGFVKSIFKNDGDCFIIKGTAGTDWKAERNDTKVAEFHNIVRSNSPP